MYSHASKDGGQNLCDVQSDDGKRDGMQDPAEAREANVVQKAVKGEHYGEPDQTRRRAPCGFRRHKKLGSGYKYQHKSARVGAAHG
jgi:hypothetical protein